MHASGSIAVPRATLQAFAQTFSEYVLADELTTNTVRRSLSRFYGMRDFYAFVQFLQFHHTYPLSKLELGQANCFGIRQGIISPHLIRWAMKLNFGDHPNHELKNILAEAILNCFFPNQDAQKASW
jgi:hypothetical protein